MSKTQRKKLYVVYDTIFTKSNIIHIPKLQIHYKNAQIKKTPNIFNMVTFGVDTQFGGNMFQNDFSSLHIIF